MYIRSVQEINMKKILGTSKISTGEKIVLIDVVRDKLGIKKDLVIFYEEDNKIVIDKAIIEE